MSRTALPLAALLLALPFAAAAEPFATNNQSALAQGFDLPVIGHGRVLARGEHRSAFVLDLTTEYTTDQTAAETITLDGESAHLTGRYRQGMDGWEWGAELAAVHVGSGFLDSFIENWHDFWGLPNGGRELAPRDRYQYRYEKDGVVLLDSTEEGWALGDLRVSAGWAATDSLALRAELKLPTGDEDQLTGGNLGSAVWGDLALPFDPDSGWSGFASAGLSVNQKGEVLEDQQETLVPFGGVGAYYRLLRQLELGAQLYAHGPLYDDSELDQLSRAGLQLAFGGRWIERGWALDVAFQEDLITKSSPDFSIHVGLRLQPE